jgi:hypothetical protein
MICRGHMRAVKCRARRQTSATARSDLEQKVAQLRYATVHPARVVGKA